MQTVRIVKNQNGTISHTHIYKGFGKKPFHSINGEKIKYVSFTGYSCQIHLMNGKTLYMELSDNPFEK